MKKAQIETYFSEREGDMGVLTETVGTLRQEAFNKLIAVREIKRKQIEDYFEKALLDMEVFARSEDVANLYTRLVQYHKDTDVQADGAYDVSTSEYKQLWEEHGEKVLQYYKDSGVCDVFMICAAHGHIMYTCAKESDLGTNLAHGPLKDSHLAGLWNRVKEEGGRAVVDFEPYAPNNGDPACFGGAPIRDESGKAIGMMVVQFPPDQINSIMQMRAGLGETGETYLVGQDQLMRSDSFLDPQHHSVIASFKDQAKGSVNTEASKAACAGKTGAKVVLDYNGRPVLSAYTTVHFEDLRFGLLAEIDVAEAFCPKSIDGEYFFKKYADMYGYYDLFLINPDGYCFYSVCREADYQTNLVDGKYADSSLGQVVREVLKTDKFGFADFEPYAPSNGAPASFIAQPVINGGETEIVVALQLPLDAINNIMGVRSGMGETGETYLIGPDKLMRSDSFLDAVNHTVAASFKDPSKGSVDTEAATAALGGAADAKIITDYNGNPVLSAYTPVDVFGTRWALLAEIDESEALAAVKEMQATSASATSSLLTWVGSLGAIAAVLVTLISVFIARSISRPINRIITGLNEGSDQVNDAAAQVSGASQGLAEGASEQASSLEETSSALEQMAAMTRTNAENAKEANSLSGQARDAAQSGDQTMERFNNAMTAINESSGQISKIIKVIEETAFQTNLLALNAAVEAARAGEHGKGFAVVAEEVRNLAQRCAQAARETTDLIEDSVVRAREGTEVAGEVGKALSAIVGDVTKVTELVDGITRASEEQAQGVDQVNVAVSQMDKVTQQNAAGAEQSASASEQLAAQAQTVKGIVGDLAALIGGGATSGGQTAVTRSAASPQGGHRKVEVAHRGKNKPQGAAHASTGHQSDTDESWKEPPASSDDSDGKLGDF